jgi:hypothetical protein
MAVRQRSLFTQFTILHVLGLHIVCGKLFNEASGICGTFERVYVDSGGFRA